MSKILIAILFIVMLASSALADTAEETAIAFIIENVTYEDTLHGRNYSWEIQGTQANLLDYFEVYAYYVEPVVEDIVREKIGTTSNYTFHYDTNRSRVVEIRAYLVDDDQYAYCSFQLEADNFLSDEYLENFKNSTDVNHELDKPDVDISLNGTTLSATWDSIDGATKYYCYLRNLTDGTTVNNKHVKECNYTYNLEPGKEYRLGVVAIPKDVGFTRITYNSGWYIGTFVAGNDSYVQVEEHTSAETLEDAEPESIIKPLSKGNKENDKDKVTELQEQLILLGYDLGKWGADGDFGDATETAVKDFQMQNGLDVTGIIDDATWQALVNASNKKEEQPPSNPVIPSSPTHEHEWVVEDDSQHITHPHNVVLKCTTCGEKKTENPKGLMCCLCGTGDHAWKENKINVYIHSNHKTCSICGITEEIVHKYDADCVICNPNNYKWDSPVLGDVTKTHGDMYLSYRESDEFKEKYLYAPNGGLWYSNATNYANGMTTHLQFVPYADYYAVYVTPEDVKLFAEFMEKRTGETALNTLKAWTFDLIGESMQTYGFDKTYQDDWKTFQTADVIMSNIDLSKEVNLTEKKMKELESIVAAIPARETDTVGEAATEFATIWSKRMSNLGKVFLWYDFISVLSYAALEETVESLAENNSGMIITKQVVWEPYLGTEVYRPVQKANPVIKEWDCSDGYYMNNDYSLYGSYAAY